MRSSDEYGSCFKTCSVDNYVDRYVMIDIDDRYVDRYVDRYKISSSTLKLPFLLKKTFQTQYQ